MSEDNKSIEEIIAISYFDTDNMDIKKHTERYFEIKRNIVNVLNKYNIMWTLTDTNGFNNKDKEIERLREELEKEKYLVDKYTRQLTDEYKNTEYQCKEKERLNNIINELEEYIKWQRKCSLSLNNGFTVSRLDVVLNKLQELKGGDKE